MNEQSLRKVLWADVIGSTTSVVFTIAAAGPIGRWLGVSAWIPFAVGIVLIPWVMMLVHTVRRDRLRPDEVAIIAVGNLAWVAGAVVLIFGFPDAMSTAGKWIVGLFSLAVLDLGTLQLLGYRTLASRKRPATV